ncbi:MAG TPA: polysaccharide deacetylase family protein [Sediminibacterium sp.]|nr:polysaccharide deacetylase family protein [Sediminibacterium sp.]
MPADPLGTHECVTYRINQATTMIRHLLIAGWLLYAGNAIAQPTRLIIRGDDMGFTHSGNMALIRCYQQGIEQSAELIVPSPWFPEAVKLLQQNPGLDPGVHLALSSEWENIKWRPLTGTSSLTNQQGYFYPMIYPNKNYPGQSLSEQPWQMADIEKEFRAQIELAMRLVPHISHLSDHMGCSHLSPALLDLVRRLADEYHLRFDLPSYGVLQTGYIGPHQTAQEKKMAFRKMLDTLQPGKTYLFLDHPGLDDAELKAVYHIGYEAVAADRQGVTDLFTDPEIIAIIRHKHIQLIPYKALPLAGKKE